MRTLVVDDRAADRRLLHAHLKAGGCAHRETRDGVEALTPLEFESVQAGVARALLPNLARHGGRVWTAEGRAGAGATFLFSLPVALSSPQPSA